MKASVMGLTVELHRDGWSAEMLAQLPSPAERELVERVAAREDTATILLTGQAGAIMGYAVIGQDGGDMLAVYAARTMDGAGFLARAALSGLLGAAQVTGAPLRFHVDDMRGRLRAAARMMGAKDFASALDGDGIPQGLFYGL